MATAAATAEDMAVPTAEDTTTNPGTFVKPINLDRTGIHCTLLIIIKWKPDFLLTKVVVRNHGVSCHVSWWSDMVSSTAISDHFAGLGRISEK